VHIPAEQSDYAVILWGIGQGGPVQVRRDGRSRRADREITPRNPVQSQHRCDLRPGDFSFGFFSFYAKRKEARQQGKPRSPLTNTPAVSANKKFPFAFPM